MSRVDTLDLKGQYKGTVVDNPGGPVLYGLVAESFPQAWIEDPRADSWKRTPSSNRIGTASPGTRRSIRSRTSRRCRSRRGRSTSSPRASDRSGGSSRPTTTARSTVSGCTAADGSSSASAGTRSVPRVLFHSDSPNDVAPAGYNLDPLDPGLPQSPLAPARRPASAGIVRHALVTRAVTRVTIHAVASLPCQTSRQPGARRRSSTR